MELIRNTTNTVDYSSLRMNQDSKFLVPKSGLDHIFDPKKPIPFSKYRIFRSVASLEARTGVRQFE